MWGGADSAMGQRAGRRCALGALAVAALALLAPVLASPPSPALPTNRRPPFTLPRIDDATVAWPIVLDPALLGAAALIDTARLPSASPARWTRQLPPLFPESVAPTTPAGAWWLGVGSGPGGTAGIERALGRAVRARVEGDAWVERLRDRDHWRIGARLDARAPSPLPDWRGALELVERKEGWDASAATGRSLPGAMHVASLEGGIQRAVGPSANRFVLGADLVWAQIRTHTCPTGDCGPGPRVERAGRWRSIGLGLRTVGSGRDLRRFASGEGGDAAMRGDFELWGGGTHRRSPDGAGASIGRWRACAVWSLARDGWQFSGGLRASGEGRRSLIGPVLGLRRASIATRTTAALALAPDLSAAEDALALPERLPEVSLIRSRPAVRLGPWAPILYDPRLPPQRAWPVLEGEILREHDAGWIDLAVTVAHLRDPLDWRPETLGTDTRLLRATPGASRVLARLALTAEQRLGAGHVLTARYRGVRDARAGDPQRGLHALPVHALELRWESRGARWRWGLWTEARGRTPAAAGTRSLPATIVCGAHAGLALGATELDCVAENLFDASPREDPYSGMTRRWVGVTWNLFDRASVP